MTKQFLILDQYAVFITTAAPQGLCGYVNHVRDRRITPVGCLLAYREEASELRLEHWSVQLFLRMGLRYNEAAGTTDPVEDFPAPKWPGWHPDLPREIGRLLLREAFCTEPMALHVNRFQEFGGLDFGQIWTEDDDT